MDPAVLRRRNLIADDAHPTQSASGMRFEGLSHHAALDKIMALMDYDALRADQAAARSRGVHRGIGLASFIELTNPGPAFYGVGGARISAQDGCTVRLDAAGGLTVQASVTEQGQGTGAILTQITAEAMGVPPERIRVQLGDTDATPYGGGTWASRGAGVGGEAAWQAARALRANVLALAGSILQAAPGTLDLDGGNVVDAAGRSVRITLADLARIAYFRPDTPADRRAARTGRDKALCSPRLPVRFHQWRAGVLARGGCRDRVHHAAEAFRGRGLRHRAQSDAGRRADPRRRRAGVGRGAVRAVRIRRPGADDQRQHGRLPGPRWPARCRT